VRATEILDEAKRVLSDGREDIAKIALKRRRAILREKVTLDRQVLEAEKEAGELQIVQQQLATRLKVYKTKQDVLTAYQTAAEAQLTADAFDDIIEDSARLQQMLQLAEKNREDTQAKVDAIAELIEDDVVKDISISKGRNKNLTGSSQEQLESEIDRELEALKREIEK
jgi:phage shock protein A